MSEDGLDYEVRTFDAGKTVFREGDTGREAFLVKRGRVTLSRLLEGTETVLETVGVGAVFGEMAVIGDAPRSATAVAEEETDLVVIDRNALKAGMEQSPPLVRRLMDHFQERLVATTGRLSPRSEGEAVRRTAEMLEQLARASVAESGEPGEPAVSYRELMDRGQRATGLRQEEIRDALARLEKDGEVACGPRKEGERPWQQIVRVLEMERLGRRTASRTAAWSREERPPEPAYLDLGEAGEALGLTSEAVLDGLLTGELPASAVRLRASVLGVAPSSGATGRAR